MLESLFNRISEPRKRKKLSQVARKPVRRVYIFAQKKYYTRARRLEFFVSPRPTLSFSFCIAIIHALYTYTHVSSARIEVLSPHIPHCSHHERRHGDSRGQARHRHRLLYYYLLYQKDLNPLSLSLSLHHACIIDIILRGGWQTNEKARARTC